MLWSLSRLRSLSVRSRPRKTEPFPDPTRTKILHRLVLRSLSMSVSRSVDASVLLLCRIERLHEAVKLFPPKCRIARQRVTAWHGMVGDVYKLCFPASL